MNPFYRSIPSSRIATFDVYEMGMRKHHVSALLEFDVSEGRRIIKELKKTGRNISFTAWIIKCIAMALEKHPEVAAYLYSKKKLLCFKEVSVSVLVEKTIGEKKVPLPLLIENASALSAEQLTETIKKAQTKQGSSSDVVLNKKTSSVERIYSYLPGFLRRIVWRVILSNPRFSYKKMGNVAVTSLTMVGKLNGWFIHASVHPVSFGLGAVLKKPVAIGEKIEIREVLNASILFDHDVIDGAPMARFLKHLASSIENAQYL